MYGIENLKKLVKFACDLTKEIAEALKDGKFKWTEAFGFIDEAAQMPAVAKSFPAVKQELADLTPEERKELYDYIVSEFDIPNESVEVLVENSLSFAVSAVALFEQWKTLKK